MSQQTFNKSNTSTFQSHISISNSKPNRLLTTSICALMLGGLTACQNTAGFNSSNATANNGFAISAPIQATPMQLSNGMDNPSISATAQAQLITAIQQHYNSAHASVSQYQTHVRPFVAGDSVDANSQSAFQTVMDVMAYAEWQQEDDGYRDEEYDAIYAIYEDLLEASDYTLSDSEAWDKAEASYQAQNQENDNDYDSDNHDYGNEYGYQSKSQLGLNVLTDFFADYQKMKEAQAEKTEETEDDYSPYAMMMLSPSLFSSTMTQMLHSSPEQVEALETYTMQYYTANSVGQYLPEQRSYQSVISYDFASPTRQLSIQAPYKVDFNRESITLDPSAVLPIMAMISPENTPLPDEMQTHTIEFSLPEEIKDQVPSQVLFDALIKGMAVGFKEMNSEDFTPVDISNDSYAKAVHAKQAIKVNWGAKQTGTFIGKVIKSMGNTIEQHIADNPSQYEEGAKLRELMDNWAMVKDDFMAKDVGGLIQMIEAVAPISFDQTQYYYLGSQGNLVAWQAKSSFGSELYGWTMDSVMQTRYDVKSVQQSPLYQLLSEDFADNAPAPINGNEWLKQQQEEDMYDSEAINARWGYDDEGDTSDDISNDVSVDDELQNQSNQSQPSQGQAGNVTEATQVATQETTQEATATSEESVQQSVERSVEQSMEKSKDDLQNEVSDEVMDDYQKSLEIFEQFEQHK